MTFYDVLVSNYEMVIVTIIAGVSSILLAPMIKYGLIVLYYKTKKLVGKNNIDYKIHLVRKTKIKKFVKSKDGKPSLSSQMSSVKKFYNVFNPQSVIYNEVFSCGCKAKDKIMVQLCPNDKQRYITFTYQLPVGFYLSDDLF